MVLVDWKGAAVRQHVAEACRLGVDATMDDAVRKARAGHPEYPPSSRPGAPYANRSGSLVSGTVVKVKALLEGSRIRGVWGNLRDYSLFVEIGTSRDDSGFPRAQARAAEGAGDMWAIPPPSEPPRMAARFTLRPAASLAYKKLGARIGAFFRGEETV